MKKLVFKMKKVMFAASLLCVSAGVFGVENQNAEWFEAAKSGNLPQLNRIIKQGVDLNAKDEKGNTALMIAAEEGHLDIVNRLISPTNEQVLNLVLEWKNGGRKLNKQSVQQWKYSYKAVDVNAKDNNGLTALMNASGKGHYEIAKLLVSEGADINAKDKNGLTALMKSAGMGCYEIAKLLVSEGADVNARNKDGETALMTASIGGHYEIVKFLVSEGADVNATSDVYSVNIGKYGGNTALMGAARNGRSDIARLLIEKGADIGAADANGETPLLHSVRNNFPNVAKLLIDAGADVNVAECVKSGCAFTGRPILMLAIEYGGSSNLVSWLIKAGADVNAPEGFPWRTPLEVAFRKKRWDIMRMLLKAGADVHTLDQFKDERNPDDWEKKLLSLAYEFAEAETERRIDAKTSH